MVSRASSVVGAPVPRQEGPDKVTGSALFAADVHLPGMLFGKVLRSPYPHARIVSIDASRVWEVPGVRAVITGQDIPGLLMGRRFRDMPVLAWDKVRFIGDRVAAVAADTAEAAEEALLRIVVEYEELPAVFDPVEAMQPDAPRLHDDIRQYQGGEQATLLADVPNGLSYQKWEKGNIEEGFRQADFVFEHTFRTPSRHNGYIEPHAGSVMIDDEGRVQVWLSGKAPFASRNQLAEVIGVPEDRVLINPVNIGGDFGGKGDIMDLPIAYFLAKQSGRPVLMAMTYLEELLNGSITHPAVITVKSGVTRDGRLTARTLTALHDGGAYGALKANPPVNVGGASLGGGPYRIDHVFLEATLVYTNTAPRGFFRGPGGPQVNFAVESHMDMMAQELGLDPAEFRLRNLLHEGDENPVGHKLRDVWEEEVLRGALDAANWSNPPGKHRGRGISMYERHIGGGRGSAVLTGELDGTITLLSPSFDQGAGAHTVLRQIVAEFLQFPLEQVRVVIANTDRVPFDAGVNAGRTTNVAGNAFVKAAEQLLAQVKAAAADHFECPVEEMVSAGGELYPREAPQRRLALADAIALAGNGQPVTITTTVDLPPDLTLSCFSAQIAEVEVDLETGQFTILKYVTAHDVGKIINPITHQGQIEGGIVQGIGMALMEEMPIEDGRVMTLNLGDYKMPTIADIPPLETVLIPAEEGPAPFSGRSIGEMTNCSAPGAIANAVAAACGVRLMDLPITAEKIYFALHGGGS